MRSLRDATQGIRRAPLLSGLSITAIGLSLFIIGMFAHQPACDLLWGPFARQLGRYRPAEIDIARQLARLGAMGAVPSGGIRRSCTIVFGATIAPDFATDCRSRTL